MENRFITVFINNEIPVQIPENIYYDMKKEGYKDETIAYKYKEMINREIEKELENYILSEEKIYLQSEYPNIDYTLKK